MELFEMSVELPADETLPGPLMPLERVRASTRNTGHLAKSLLNTSLQRYYFDPADPEDRRVYYVFSQTGKWLKQYYFQAPDKTVVAMIQRRLIEYALRREAATSADIVASVLASKPNAVKST